MKRIQEEDEKDEVSFGDPDDHELARPFEPNSRVIAAWLVAELIVGVGSFALFYENSGESVNYTKLFLDMATMLSILPIVYVGGLLYWIDHMDTRHYSHGTDHLHVTTIPKDILYQLRRALKNKRKK